MVFLDSVNAYLHQSSLLLTTYPSTTRITTKYTLPRKTPPPERPIPANRLTTKNSSKVEKSKNLPRKTKNADTNGDVAMTDSSAAGDSKHPKPKPATLTFKTYEPGSGICLKYSTDKQAEVGRLMLGLGRLAAGETIEEPSTAPPTTGPAAEDKMDVDTTEGKTSDSAPTTTASVTPAPAPQQSTGGQGGGKKKKKGKK